MKKILVSIILAIFLISFASALGNVASWDKDPIDNNGNHYAYGHYKIKNIWGIPIISSTIAEYSLIYNTDKCNVGNECKAIGEAILHDDVPLFNDVSFFDKDGLTQELESYQWYISTHTEEKQQLVCDRDEDNCYLENYTEDVWDVYNYESLPAGTYKWKLSGYKKEDILIDWIATSNEETLIEWADWDVGTWTNLSATDTGDWATGTVNSVSYDSINDLVYTTLSSGQFGVYNRTSNIWLDLSGTDTGNWIGTSNILSSTYNNNSDLVYIGLNFAKFGVYNRTSNITTDLSGTDPGNWALGNTFSLVYNPSNNLIYNGETGGYFGSYNRTSNIWLDLSGTDTGNWIGGSTIYGLDYNPNNNLIYILTSGNFGVYNATSNVSINLSDPGVNLYSLTYDSFSNSLYAGGDSNLFKVYNITSDTWTDLSGTDTGNWAFTASLRALVSAKLGLIYTGIFIGTGRFGVYNYTSNVWTDLSATDTGNWVDSTGVNKLTYDPIRDLIYTGLSSAKFGVYIGTALPSPPTVTLNSPADNANVSLNIAFNCSAIDNANVLNLTLIIDSADNYTITNSSASQTYISLQQIYNLTEGSHNWTCRASDGDGNNVTTSTRFLTVDLTNPNINFTSPTETSGSVYSRTNIIINVTASDSGTGLKNITIYLYNSTGLRNSTTSTTSPLFLNFTSLIDGLYFFNATAFDNAKNSNKTETRNITIDTTSPSISIIAPANITYNNKTQLVNISSNGDYIWFYNGTANVTYTAPVYVIFNEGSNTLTAYANDTVNNVNSTSVTFSIDLTNPNATLISPANASYSNASTINFTANISDDVGINYTILNIYNQTSLVNQTTSFWGGLLNAIIGIPVTLIDNVYSWFVTIVDYAGNSFMTANNTVPLIQ